MRAMAASVGRGNHRWPRKQPNGNTPHPDELIRLCEELRVTSDWLLLGQEETLDVATCRLLWKAEKLDRSAYCGRPAS
jgi:hypothetical protein